MTQELPGFTFIPDISGDVVSVSRPAEGVESSHQGSLCALRQLLEYGKPIRRARRPHIEQIAVVALRQVDVGQNDGGRFETLELVDRAPAGARRVADTGAKARDEASIRRQTGTSVPDRQPVGYLNS